MNLNTEQLAAVNADGPRIVCVAGAGTGKTRVMVSRVARLIREGVRPSQILVITFTRRAAAELRVRLDAEFEGLGAERPLDWKSGRPYVGTIHAWAASLVREYPEFFANRTASFSLYGEDDCARLMMEVAVERGYSAKSRPETWRKDPALMADYLDRLRAANALDYDGLEEAALKLVLNQTVATQLRRRYTHVLVDEVQDTANFEFDLILRLDPDNLFVVGDSRQGIYSFRGAFGPLFGYALANWHRIDLVVNYRSYAPIIDAANEVAKRMGQGHVPMQAANAHVMFPVKVHGSQGPRKVLTDVVAYEVKARHPRDVAVLCRTWAEVEDVVTRLTEASIPVKRPTKNPMPRMLGYLIRLVQNPHDPNLAGWMLQDAGMAGVNVAWRRVSALEERKSVLDGLPIGELLANESRRCPVSIFERNAYEALGILGSLPLHFKDDQTPLGELFDSIAGLDEADGAAMGDGVSVMTIHAAKGLEWSVVLVAGCDDDTFGQEELEDHNLLYVAMTRARTKLHLFHHDGHKHSRWGAPKLVGLAKVLRDLPGVEAQAGAPAVWGDSPWTTP